MFCSQAGFLQTTAQMIEKTRRQKHCVAEKLLHTREQETNDTEYRTFNKNYAFYMWEQGWNRERVSRICTRIVPWCEGCFWIRLMAAHNFSACSHNNHRVTVFSRPLE